MAVREKRAMVIGLPRIGAYQVDALFGARVVPVGGACQPLWRRHKVRTRVASGGVSGEIDAAE